MTDIVGWIWRDNLDKFIRLVAAYVDYRWDDLDGDALVGALDATDMDKPDAWFEYQIVGSPPLTLALARDVDSSSVLGIRVTGAFDAVLGVRVRTLIDAYSC